jgi:predicted nucleotidyltransferase
MRPQKAENRQAYESVLDWFLMQPDKAVSLRQLSGIVNIHPRAVGNAVRQLAREQFIIKTVVGRSWQLVANQNHPFFTTRKIPRNLMLIYESGIMNEVLKRWKNPVAIVLFGSYRHGRDKETSDIDIAVELPGDQEYQIEELGTIQLPFRKPTRVQVHKYSRKNVNPNLFVNIANGIVLYGLLEVRP